MVDGYVTQNRLVDKPPGSYKDPYDYRRQAGSPVVTGLSDYRINETTTSFRTGLSAVPPEIKTGVDQLRFLMGSTENQHDKSRDNGHTFKTEKLVTIPIRNQSFVLDSDRFFHGPIECVNANPSFFGGSALPSEPPFDLAFFGNRLVVSATPTLPKSNVMQSFAELAREGFAQSVGASIDHSIRKRADFFRSLGSEYLNVQFGWLPFLNDLNDIVKSISNANNALRDLVRNDGLLVRRRRSLPPRITSETQRASSGGRIYVNGEFSPNAWWGPYNSGEDPITITKSTRQDVWFSGAFTYKLAIEDSLLGKFERYEQYAQHLLGTRITPSVLWELTPWSWLVDWGVDIQSALQRAELTQQDGNVMKYGYLMRKTMQRIDYSIPVTYSNGALRHYQSSQYREVKERYRATPFGFGLNVNLFTDRQWAILAALGLSKGPRSLF